MHTFKTSSGYVFTFFDKGDTCKVVAGLQKTFIIPIGSIVKVLTGPDAFRRSVLVLDEKTGKQESIQCDMLELVEAAGGVQTKIGQSDSEDQEEQELLPELWASNDSSEGRT